MKPDDDHVRRGLPPVPAGKDDARGLLWLAAIERQRIEAIKADPVSLRREIIKLSLTGRRPKKLAYLATEEQVRAIMKAFNAFVAAEPAPTRRRSR